MTKKEYNLVILKTIVFGSIACLILASVIICCERTLNNFKEIEDKTYIVDNDTTRIENVDSCELFDKFSHSGNCEYCNRRHSREVEKIINNSIHK